MNDDRTARAALTRLFEPGDTVGLPLVAKHGANEALSIAIGAHPAYPFADMTAGELATALDRWAPRVRKLDANADLAAIERLGGGFLTPDDECWPAGLNDLPAPPLGLWYMGNITGGVGH